jgi:hypothetical protein
MSVQPTETPDNLRPEVRRPEIRRPDIRRPAGVSRLGVLTGFLATAGTLGVAFLGLGGPPAPPTPLALADASATEPAIQQVVVKTVYVQLPSPTTVPVAAPAAVAPRAAARVVTRQSGARGDDRGDDAGENEGDD